MSSSISLRMESVSYVWNDGLGATAALRGVTTEFPAGSAHFICGPSGAGKSTLGMILAGLVTPSSGRVELVGVSPEAVRQRIAYLFQFPEAVFFTDSVAQELHDICAGFPHDHWEEAFRQTGIDLADVAHRHPFTLSEGYGRLTALAMQLARKPDVLILDEPTIGLDWEHQERVVRTLREWIAPHRILVIVTHDVDMLTELRGTTRVLIGGALEWSGATADLLNDHRLQRRAALLA